MNPGLVPILLGRRDRLLVLDDQFQRAPGPLVGTAAPQGQVWTLNQGQSPLISASGVRTAAAGGQQVVIETGVRDKLIEMTAVPATGGNINFTILFGNSAMNMAGTQIIYYPPSGSQMNIGNFGVSGSHTYSMALRGLNLFFTRDGVQIGTYTLTQAQYNAFTNVTRAGIQFFDESPSSGTFVTRFRVTR